MKKTLILILLALLAAPLWGQTKLSRIRTAAEQGDAMAQCALGCHYDSIQDFKQGLYWHQKASSLGYNWANCALGLYYATGKGVPLDRNKAVYWFDKAKKAGVPSELYPIIRYGEAMSGDPRTQCIIAVEIFKSPCNNRDEVNFWLSQSANQGYADAQFFLAVSLGEDGDHIKAFTWLIKAASQGHAEAQYLLGTQLYLGEAPLQLTPEAREKQALVWFKEAKAQESKLSEESRFMVNALIDEIEKSSNGTTSHRNAGATTPAKNTTTTSSSTPKKDTGMEFDENLRVTQRGNTPPVPAPSAAELFAQADNYRYGRNGVAKNAQKAVELYTQAANMGDAEAQLSLGYCYYMGEGVSENCQKAYEWLKKAEAKKHTLSAARQQLLETTLANTAACAQPQKTTQSYTPTYSQPSSRKTRNKYGSWPWYYDGISHGIHFAYIQRAILGREAGSGASGHYDIFGNEGWSKGFQFGFHFNPMGKNEIIGMNTGFYMEFLFDRWKGAPSDYYDAYAEMNLHVPLEMVLYLPLKPWKSALHLRAGLGADFSCFGQLIAWDDSYSPNLDVTYGSDFINRFNLSLNLGISLHYDKWMFHATWQKGLLRHPYAPGYRCTLDKLSLGLSFVVDD